MSYIVMVYFMPIRGIESTSNLKGFFLGFIVILIYNISVWGVYPLYNILDYENPTPSRLA